MRLGIKGKQVLSVTLLVGAAVVTLSVLHLGNLARVSLAESQARAELLAGAIYSRAREVIVLAPRCGSISPAPGAGLPRWWPRNPLPTAPRSGVPPRVSSRPFESWRRSRLVAVHRDDPRGSMPGPLHPRPTCPLPGRMIGT